MAGRLAPWTAFLLLASMTAFRTVTAVQTITITSMEWNFVDSTALTLCASEQLGPNNVTLIVNDPESGITDYVGSIKSENNSCADFNDERLQMPEANTIYELLVIDPTDGTLQQGYITFSSAITVSQTVVNCSGSEFVRVSISTGNFADQSCIFDEKNPLVCYSDVQSPRICVVGVDATLPDLQVCVTQTPTDGTTGVPSCVLTGLSLDYEKKSMSVSSGPGGTLTDLLYREQGITSVVSCNSNGCPIADFSPSTNIYELCGVYLDGDGAVTGSCTSTFQDIDLTVVEAEPLLDFYLWNVYSEQKYMVFTGTDSELVLEGDGILLDCTGIPENQKCYGFVAPGDAVPSYLAIGDVDETSAIITPTVASGPKDANPDA